MDFSFSEKDEEFRMKVRDFFENEYPRDIIEKMGSGASPSKDDYQRSERAMAAKGWLAVNWPKSAGGTGWSANEKYIFDEELERAGALNVVPMGLLYVGPVIYTFGTEEQKKRFLPGILNSTTFWAQGYSEPGSGSDLASLQCSAVSDGDDYIVNGTKIWTSLGQHADWIFCLLRTSHEEKKQEGITFLLIDMKTPGITVHPIITIDGKHSLNSVTFDNVRVPQENRIGEEGKGWTYANYLLGHERTSYAHVAGKRKQLANTRIVARERGLLEDPSFVEKLASLEARLDALELTVLRTLSSVAEGGAPGNESSILKIIATELAQDITELGMEAWGPYMQPAFPDSVAPAWTDNTALPAGAAPSVASYLGARAQSIYGGSNEIQKNIIAKRILGL
ncbi:acyl-CoA dehydrogenase family protein [Parvibaculum sp.]|jgi:alkylation response protein AidB-like acyl-CoA dehydrogenase|uniref:acyl-CoA dehydrogenase family protein n=1 Tax=Parvibaculum sp. TaxID=2024848 RepID=UPI000C4C342A|nr:acyl-CoA dehydrogenase family protein [Parvibaculum sp.]MAU61976.1 acyl-CoA dehydrogenase [Parvibaculum sp.]MBO6666868.1 acyl-CoA dehydrogenase family protein [Parvibaculum sp.]MBO6691614.1 acyl-CoA dehydrogenase family protein [Parvibaculum sp.]MBO6713489.1 acyl-CoA dehydrogenase family protein [Parvibaculum sp.]|tara:strand:+ start:12832 stop:14013 length:1182 start_codon:yes stop_codon:yes gene_type:complete